MDISSQAISALRDEQVFVLSGSQLQAIITKALLEAQGSTFSGQDELSSMKTEIDGLKSQIKELDSYVSALAINQKGQSMTDIINGILAGLEDFTEGRCTHFKNDEELEEYLMSL